MTHKEALIAAIEMRKIALSDDTKNHDRFSALEHKSEANMKILSVLSDGMKTNGEAISKLEKEYQDAYGSDNASEGGAQ